MIGSDLMISRSIFQNSDSPFPVFKQEFLKSIILTVDFTLISFQDLSVCMCFVKEVLCNPGIHFLDLNLIVNEHFKVNTSA